MHWGNLYDGVLLLSLALSVVIWPTQLISDAQYRWLRIIAVGLTALQLVVDGPRIQLIPAYFVAALFLVLLIPRASSTEPSAIRERTERFSKRLARWTMVVVVGLTVTLSIVLCVYFPRFAFPEVTGNYQLGVREVRVVDDARVEPNTADPNDRRELLLRITYPADAAGDASGFSVATVPNVGLAALATLLPLKERLIHPALKWGRVPTHQRVDAPVSRDRAAFPVLLFSHGHGGIPEQNTALVEELASHGYIVVAINHAYASALYEYADGLGVMTAMPARVDAVADEITPEIRATVRELNAARSSTSNVADMVTSERKVVALIPRTSKVYEDVHREVSDDQRFAIGYLESLQSVDPILKGRLDTTRVGVLGMSMGGTASLITCSLDARCKAGINLDGFNSATLDIPPLTTPFMVMNNSQSQSGLIAVTSAQASAYHLQIEDSRHYNFTDVALAAPKLRQLGILGRIDGARMNRIVNDYALAFFDHHLMNATTSPSSSTSRYPEVVFMGNESR